MICVVIMQNYYKIGYNGNCALIEIIMVVKFTQSPRPIYDFIVIC